MFVHTGYKSLWPAVFFLPWLLVGFAYLFEGVFRRHPKALVVRPRVTVQSARNRWLVTAAVILGVVSLAATGITRADDVPDAARACEAHAPSEARQLADLLYEKGDYQRAGICYDAAGDSLRAQRAYVKAVGPSAEDTARKLRAQSNSAKALFSQVQDAFRSNH
jgi:hypothetical protein